MSQVNGTAHAWTDLSAQLNKAVAQLDKDIANDGQFQVFANTRAITKPVTFVIRAAGSNQPILITVEDNKGNTATSKFSKPEFTLVAFPGNGKNSSNRHLRFHIRAIGKVFVVQSTCPHFLAM